MTPCAGMSRRKRGKQRGIVGVSAEIVAAGKARIETDARGGWRLCESRCSARRAAALCDRQAAQRAARACRIGVPRLAAAPRRWPQPRRRGFAGIAAHAGDRRRNRGPRRTCPEMPRPVRCTSRAMLSGSRRRSIVARSVELTGWNISLPVSDWNGAVSVTCSPIAMPGTLALIAASDVVSSRVKAGATTMTEVALRRPRSSRSRIAAFTPCESP